MLKLDFSRRAARFEPSFGFGARGLRMSNPRPDLSTDDPVGSLWQAAVAFRLVTTLYAAVIQFTSVPHYTRPAASWMFFAFQCMWSGWASMVLTQRPAWRKPVVIGDQLVAAFLMGITWYVAPETWWDHYQSFPTTIWVCNAIVSAGLLGGVAWGLVSGVCLARN